MLHIRPRAPRAFLNIGRYGKTSVELVIQSLQSYIASKYCLDVMQFNSDTCHIANLRGYINTDLTFSFECAVVINQLNILQIIETLT